MGLVDQVPSRGLVERFQRALTGLAPALGRNDRDGIVAGDQLLALLDPVGHELPFGGLGAQLGDELDALAICQRRRSCELVPCPCLRGFRARDDPADRLKHRAGKTELGIEDIANDLLGIPGCPAIRESSHGHGTDVEPRHLRGR